MTKISELTSIVTAAATDIIAVVQGGVTKKATVQDYRDAGIIPTADQATALAAYQAALAAAETGQVLTGDGAGGAAFESPGGGWVGRQSLGSIAEGTNTINISGIAPGAKSALIGITLSDDGASPGQGYTVKIDAADNTPRWNQRHEAGEVTRYYQANVAIQSDIFKFILTQDSAESYPLISIWLFEAM